VRRWGPMLPVFMLEVRFLSCLFGVCSLRDLLPLIPLLSAAASLLVPSIRSMPRPTLLLKRLWHLWDGGSPPPPAAGVTRAGAVPLFSEPKLARGYSFAHASELPSL